MRNFIVSLLFTFIICFFAGCFLFRMKPAVRAFSATKFPENFFYESKFRKGNGFIIVKAVLESDTTPTDLIFDTGSPCTFSFKTKKKYNLKAKTLYSLPGIKTQYGKANIQYGNIKYQNLTVLYTNHPALFRYVGIIGSNALHKGIWEINFKDSTIKGSNDHSRFNNIDGAYVANFRTYPGQQTPIVKLYFGGDSVDAFIDTGEWGLLKVNEDFNKKVKTQERALSYMKFGKRTLFLDWCRYPEMRLGTLKIDSVCTTAEPGYRGKNCLGLGFLSRYIVTIDWVNKKIYFKAIEQAGGRGYKSVYSYGLLVYTDRRVVKVHEVFKASPAEKAGINPNDTIQSINGKPAIDAFSEVPDYYETDMSSKELKIEVKGKGKFTFSKQPIFESFKVD